MYKLYYGIQLFRYDRIILFRDFIDIVVIFIILREKDQLIEGIIWYNINNSNEQEENCRRDMLRCIIRV